MFIPISKATLTLMSIKPIQAECMLFYWKHVSNLSGVRIYSFFTEESGASKFYACVCFAVKAAKADELSYDAETANNSDYDAETIVNNSEDDSVSSLESFDNFHPTQDFNVGAQALAQELLASYE